MSRSRHERTRKKAVPDVGRSGCNVSEVGISLSRCINRSRVLVPKCPGEAGELGRSLLRPCWLVRSLSFVLSAMGNHERILIGEVTKFDLEMIRKCC